jgi:CBS-domain-containing membrane protein
VSLARVDDPSQKMLFSSFGAAIFILSLGLLDPLSRGAVDLPALIPPFGASTVIVFFAPETPASRPWNIIVGHLGSALVASLVLLALPHSALAFQAALAVAGAALWMVTTRSIHPPGGATALLAVIGGPKLGFGLDLLPLALGCLTLVGTRWLLDSALELVEARGSTRERSMASRSSDAPSDAAEIVDT